MLLTADTLASMVNALAALGSQSTDGAFTPSQTLAFATGHNNQIGSIPSGQGQGQVLRLIELRNGELISGGGDGSLRAFLMPQSAIGKACKELQEHPVLLSPKTSPEQAARQTCLNHGFLKG